MFNAVIKFHNDNNVDKLDQICFAAHQDDVEFMAFQGIFYCLNNNKKFGAVVVADGRGSPRSGKFMSVTDDEMMKIRQEEQLKAAEIGSYAMLQMLNYPSSVIKDKNDNSIIADFEKILLKYRPEIIYTHNLADKHNTHLGVAVKVIKALRNISMQFMPKQVLGCEVWRSLDWVCDDEKIVCDVSEGRDLASRLMNVFVSQIEGGKNYALANDGRRFANATFSQSHGVDVATQSTLSIDLTDLIKNKNIDIIKYITGYIDRFKDDVENNLRSLV